MGSPVAKGLVARLVAVVASLAVLWLADILLDQRATGQPHVWSVVHVAGAVTALCGVLFVFIPTRRRLREKYADLERTVAQSAHELEALRSEREDLSARRESVHRELDRVWDLSLDLLCVAGFDGYFKQLNPGWEKLLGYSAEELVSVPYVDLVHPDDRVATEAASAKVREDTVPAFESSYRCKDGTYRWLSWTALPDHDEKLIYAVARDVTERKASDELRVRQLPLERLVADISRDFATAAHDDIGGRIDKALADVSAFCGADRAAVLVGAADRHGVGDVHEWCAPGAASRMEFWRGLEADQYRVWAPEVE